MLSVTKERYIALDDHLWHGPEEAATPVKVFSYGMDRICADIEALTMESSQRLFPPHRTRKSKKKPEASCGTRVLSVRTQYKLLLKQINENPDAADSTFRKALGIGGTDDGNRN